MADILEIKNGILKKCTDKSVTSVIIPEGVTQIGEMAFEDCASLSSVLIPESVTKIGSCAFYGCTSLSSVVIPPSVKEIDEHEFHDCTALSSLEIPHGVVKIGHEAFKDCASLSSIVIPASVAEIDFYAFLGCKSLSKVTLEDDFEKVPPAWFDSLNHANPNYEIVCTEGSSTFKAVKRSAKLRTHLKEIALQIAKEKKILEVQTAGEEALIGALLENFEDSLFEIFQNKRGADVALVKIGRNAGFFKLGSNHSRWLPKLQKVVEALSDSSKSGAEILSVIENQKLPLADFPQWRMKNVLNADGEGSLRIFASGTLFKSEYDGLKNLELFGFSEIGDGAAESACCATLSSVSIPSGVTKIGDNAFSCCGMLSSVVIPPSVTEIGANAFSGCQSLSSVEIPSSVTKIGWGAFGGCKSLVSVKIPNSVTKIGMEAFYGCSSLSSVEFGGTVAQWEAVDKILLAKGTKLKCVKCTDGETGI